MSAGGFLGSAECRYRSGLPAVRRNPGHQGTERGCSGRRAHSLPPAEPGGTPGSVRGAGAGPPGAGIWARSRGCSSGSRDLSAVLGSVGSEPRSVRGAGVGPLGAEICPWCWGRSRLGTRLRVLRPWQDMVKRLCQRDSSAGLGGGKKRRRGLAAPGAERGFRNPHPAHDVQADLASAPKLEGSSSREMMRDYLDWGWGEKDAKQVMLPARVRGCTPQLSVLCSPQGQSLFRDQLVPSRAAPTD